MKNISKNNPMKPITESPEEDLASSHIDIKWYSSKASFKNREVSEFDCSSAVGESKVNKVEIKKFLPQLEEINRAERAKEERSVALFRYSLCSCIAQTLYCVWKSSISNIPRQKIQ